MKLKQIISAALITALFPFGTGITALGSEEDTVKELPNADVEITESGGVIHFDYGNDYTVLLDSDSGISTASDYPILSTTSSAAYNNDLSSLQYITSPKNQGSLGTCWDFSATSCIETLLMMKDNATDATLAKYNLSEMHPALAMSTSFLQDGGSYGYVGRAYSGGGNGEIYTTYMTRAADADNNIFVGPVEELDMAYSTSSTTINAITADDMNIDTTGGYFPGTFSSLDFSEATDIR
ncbi:MAG: hypothetical protein LUD77_01360 [Clostridiales bacterium]|nr:hypothetical protein [Clostridiales bacterium]